MVKLKTQTALGADVPLSATIGVLSISENNDLALASLTKPKTSKASQVFGMSLPDIGRYSTKARILFFGLDLINGWSAEMAKRN